ncbi:hypothetical protein P4O66_007160 [Electrophorus voltai]|uniref:Uncharacterized protein n=1 Tax=Electrophorus voltai TaxID=2609070 RepID=A0AAD8ZI44_9TELE|nr:hypothetical protein P4O66_007160 [Electrophorus voltai]
MMRESRLTNFQQRQINHQLNKGGALPLLCNPTSSAPPVQPRPRISENGTYSTRPHKRSAEQCSADNSYTREKFRPSATRDLEKEKRRLQNILATGQDEAPPSRSQAPPTKGGEESERDRFQEVLNEIEERRQFLEEMSALGRRNHYHHIINTEISQKIRELELIDRAHSKELRTLMMKEKDKEKETTDEGQQ